MTEGQRAAVAELPGRDVVVLDVVGVEGPVERPLPLDAEQREFAENARSSGESLLSLINDVLDFSKIEAGHLELESVDFDLEALIESIPMPVLTTIASVARRALGLGPRERDAPMPRRARRA